MTTPVLDLATVRADFPILQQTVHGRPLIYLDSAATSQKPRSVVEAVDRFYRCQNANVHRGVYALSEEATELYEGARARIAAFVGATPQEVVFTRNATEAINLVAYTWGRANVGPGDTILLTTMEHHSNLVPWQWLARERGARLRFLPFDRQGRLVLDNLDRILAEGVKLFAFTHVSNALGTINPAHDLIRRAHAAGATVLVDGCQSVPHRPVNVRDLDCDFLVFSGHKLCGPTGIGALVGKREILEEMEPFLFGGDMIRRVTLEGATWNDLPWKFEAGTPAIAEAIGLAAAVEYLCGIGMDAIAAHEAELVAYALDRLAEVPGCIVYGPPAPEHGAAISFNVADIHPHDLAYLLDQDGICVRAGHHCCHPAMEALGVPGTTRASFYLYNSTEEIDALVAALLRARKVFKL